MPINERFRELLFLLKKNSSEAALMLKTSQPTISKILDGQRLPNPKILQVLAEDLNVNINWLLAEQGEMFLKEEGKAVAIHKSKNADLKPIPLVNAEAVAGFGAESFTIEEQDVEDYYVIPEFRNTLIDFMIRVRGDSMMPRYCNGDIVACAIIRESKFLQWNAIHIIGTKEQGILMKRIKRGQDLKGLRLVSENPDFDAFEVQKSEITGIAIVKGGIKIE